MNESKQPFPAQPEALADDTAAGVSRRRLLRAGLSAAPVMAALKSNTVLAGGGHSCVRPSSFSSLTAAQMQVSQGRVINDDYACQSHGYWKNRNDGLASGYKTSTPFLGSVTGFTANPGGFFTNKNLQQVLESGGNQNNTALARHVVAAFLSGVSVNFDPDRALLSKAQCQQIWNGQGVWSPFAGAQWTLDQTKAYFDTIFGPAFL